MRAAERSGARGGARSKERGTGRTAADDGATALMHWRPSVADEAADQALAGFLEAAWRRLRSDSRQPPSCPRCGTQDASPCGHDSSGLPQFLCHACRRRFNRLTGTPMARLRPQDKLRAFFGIASHHWSVADAARQLGVSSDTVLHWSLQTRLWLLELDPSGTWERRVQLGVHYRFVPATVPATVPAVAGCRCEPPAAETAGALQDGGLQRICPLCEQAKHA